jgi:hypothetical protein
MKRDEAISRLQQHQADLKRLGVEHLYLFGSTARGEAGDDSDVDLFFDFADLTIPRRGSCCAPATCDSVCLRFSANRRRRTMGDNEKRSGAGRRTTKDRRSGIDTRPESEKHVIGERRSGSDRRSNPDRRAGLGDKPQVPEQIK